MKTCNAQIEEVKELLQNIVGIAVGYDGFSEDNDSLKGLIDEMSDWACEALKILEKLPRDSRGKEDVGTINICTCYASSGTGCVNASCPIHGAKK